MIRPSLLLIALVMFGGVVAACAEEPSLSDQVTPLLEELGSPTAADRRAAEESLAELAGESVISGEAVLSQLPANDSSMPPEVRQSLERLRTRIESRLAVQATQASRVTLRAVQEPLSKVLAELEKQTGNRFIDNREAFGGDAIDRPVTLALDNEPFWPAVDQLLDEAKLSLYAYGEPGALSIVAREPDASRRVGAGTYGGPFRFEPLSLAATRGLREESQSRLDVQIELAWEPRLRPIAISQPLEALTITGSDETPLTVRTPEQSIDLEATPGEQALQMIISLALPPRSVKRIEKIRGQLTAIVPATQREFRVENLGEAELPVVQEFGDATVTLEKFVKQNEIWELHMRLSLANAGDALASHRGWVFQNRTYLLKPDGTRLEHAGFETTVQNDSEIGVAYLFDLSGGAIYDFNFNEEAVAAEEAKPTDPNELTWVYETPTGVYTVPVSWELGPIKLP